MKAQTLLTIVVLVSSTAAVVVLALFLIDLATDFEIPRIRAGAILIAALGVLRMCAKALSKSRSVKDA